MSATGNPTSSWTAIGKSTTSPVQNTKRAEVELDDYYLVVGFEVNKPSAFVNGTHDLSVDYGHAFFYLVKNISIVKVFSFGPTGLGKVGWFNKGERIGRNSYNTAAFKKDGFRNARPGTPDFPISEPVKAFRIALSAGQAKALETEVDKIRSDIYRGKVQYSAMMNATCAETAKEVLDDAGISTPSGYGLVKHSGIINFPLAFAVNPYKWHKDFLALYKEASYKPEFDGQWFPTPGESDPIFAAPNFAKSDPIFGVKL